ncbi:cytochrome P450 monooxygenase CYP63 [Phellopilus nigrolimitatus]|nr:cytochrome P450 monooxygenase CYP63 [Phellopilus nigrolimitatus]
MWLNPKLYRTRLFLDVLRIFVLPCVVLSQSCRHVKVRLGLFTLPAHLLAIVFWGFLRNVYYDSKQTQQARRLGARPIPRIKGKWPGNIDILLRMMKAFKTAYLMDVYLELFQEYKCTTLNTRILWVDQIITMDEEHMKFVHATGFNNFWRGRRQKERMEEFLGDGIFNRDDEKWKIHRVTARPFFARERISDFQIFDKHTTTTLNLLSRITASEQPCDAQDLYARFTLDSASEFLFGNNLDTLSLSLPEPGKAKMGPKGSATNDAFGSFAQAFEQAQCVITQRARLGYFWPVAEVKKNKIKEAGQVTKKWLDPLVQRAIDEKAKAKRAGVEAPISERTFMEHLAQNVGLIRDELLSILLASRDTTACLLTFVTYFMAMYPEVAKRMRDEVLQTHGLDRIPTYESLRGLKYVRAVLNETLRLFPPVPLNVRESRPAPISLPPSNLPSYTTAASPYPHIPFIPTPTEPLYMPGGTPIMYMPMLMQRNPDLWGPDADIFDPERFLNPARTAKLSANPMMFTPFSAGPRICIGQNFAYNEASFFLVRLLQQFDTFTLAPEFQPEGSLPPTHWKAKQGRQAIERCWPAAALTLYVKGGLWVRFKKASHN